MPVVPTYESHVTLNPTPVKDSQFVDTSKMFPNTAPDFTKVSAAAMAYQKKVDTSRALEAKNHALEYVYNATYGDNGYQKLQGKNALAKDEHGNGLVQRSLSDFDEHMNRYFSENEFTSSQQRLIRDEVTKVRLQFQAGVGSHVLQQQTTYDRAQVKAGVQNAINLGSNAFNNPQGFASGAENLKDTLLKAKVIFGWSDEQMKAEETTAMSAYYANGISAAMLSMDKDPVNGFRSAQAIFKVHSKDMTAADNLKYQEALQKAEVFATSVGLSEDFQRAQLVLQNPEAKTLSQVVTNGVRVPTQVILSGLRSGNTSQANKQYANGGWGLSALTLQTAKKVVSEHPELGKWDENKFKSQADYNYKIGMIYVEDLAKKHQGNIEEVIAAYRFGEKSLELAKKEGGADWMKHLPDNGQDVRSIVKRIQDKQKGLVYDINGNKQNTLSTEYFATTLSPMSREEVSLWVGAKTPQYVKGSAAHEQIVTRVFQDQQRRVQAQKEEFKSTIARCINSINKGEHPSQGDLAKLPIETQGMLNTLHNYRVLGYTEPDPEAIALFTAHPEQMSLYDDGEYRNTIRPLFGKDADKMDAIRAKAKQAIFDAQDLSKDANRKTTQGELDAQFAPSTADIKTAYEEIFGVKLDMKNDSDRGVLMRLTDAALIEGQRRARFTSTGKAVPLTAYELKTWMNEWYTKNIGETGYKPMFMSLKQFSNGADTDAQRVLEEFTKAYGVKKYGENYTVCDLHKEHVLACLLQGVPLDFDMDAALKGIRLSDPIRREAEANLKTDNPAMLLGEYLQLCVRGIKAPQNINVSNNLKETTPW